jgi:hypothetical protein
MTSGTKAPAYPDTPEGRQLQWYIRSLATGGDGSTLGDRDRFGGKVARWFADVPDDDAWRAGWKHAAAMYGSFVVTGVAPSDEGILTASLTGADGKRWLIGVEVEPAPPHRIVDICVDREREVEVTSRRAEPSDGPALTDLDHRCPIDLGNRSMVIDRGKDYFAFARLAGGCDAGIALVDGVPAAINCRVLHSMRVAGRDLVVSTALHTRVDPAYRGLGLWPVASRAMDDGTGPDYDCSRAFVSVDNAAMQRGFRNHPAKWPIEAVRAHLSTEALAGPTIGRPATPEDADRVVQLLNACHDGEEMYVPYTTATLADRLERASDLYSWDRLWLTDNAVVGVWPSGDSIRVITTTPDGTTESRRGLVLDYGFEPTAADELEALLRAWCAWLRGHDHDELAIFTSVGSAGYDIVAGLATRLEPFNCWTPGLQPPERVESGIYTDPVYF